MTTTNPDPAAVLANILATFDATIVQAEAELAAGLGLDAFNLVGDHFMAVVQAEGGGLRLGGLTKGRAFTLSNQVAAEAAAEHWNRQLRPDQVEAGCSVKAMSRREALEGLVVQVRELRAGFAARA